MFEKIRKPRRAKNIFAYIIFSLICLVFVFLGVPTDPLSGAGGFAALVDKQVISIADFYQRLSLVQENQSSTLKRDTERQKADQRLVLNQLIDEKLMFTAAQTAGLKVSNQELRHQIKSFPAFQEEGKFQNSLYRNYLESTRTSPEGFENNIRTFILLQRMEKLFNRVFFISRPEKEKNSDLNNFEFQFKYVRIPFNTAVSDSAVNLGQWQNLLKSTKLVEQELKKQGLEWIQSSPVTLNNWSSALPVLVDSDELFDSVLEVVPERGLVPKLLVQADYMVLVYLTNFKVKKPQKLKLQQDILSFSISRIIFSSWIQFMKEQSHIQINPKLLQ